MTSGNGNYGAIPVMGGHSEAVNVEFEEDFDLNEVRLYWQERRGLLSWMTPLPANIRCRAIRMRRMRCLWEGCGGMNPAQDIEHVGGE